MQQHFKATAGCAELLFRATATNNFSILYLSNCWLFFSERFKWFFALKTLRLRSDTVSWNILSMLHSSILMRCHEIFYKNLETNFCLGLKIEPETGLGNSAGGKHLHVLQGSLTSNAQKPHTETKTRLQVSVCEWIIWGV